VNWIDDPVDARILADSLVLGIDKDNLEVLVGRVLVDPVRVQDAKVGATATNTLLSGGLEGSLVLELVDTLVGGLACRPCQYFASRSARRFTYRRWHPWARVACDHHDEHARGRSHSPAWPCNPDGAPCRGGRDGKRGG
jgi:hypothetical protein